MNKIWLPLLAGGLLLGAPACTDLTSPNYNFGDLDELVNNPTPTSINTAAVGVLYGNRIYMRTGNDYVSMLGILGRESYYNDIADPRFETEMLGSALNPGSPAFGGNYWQEPYENIRLGQITLDGVGQLSDGDYPPSAKEWTRGFVKTINALDFLTLVNTRDTNCGCPITLPENVEDPAPEASKEQVFAKIVQLLDEAAAHLQAASGAAPFSLPSGFDGLPGTGAGYFNDADHFLAFNRGIRARVAVYMGDYNAALQALAGSFLDTSAPLEFGVYHSFSEASGDLINELFDPGTNRLKAHPSIKADVELKTDGTPDDRFTSKTRVLTNVAYGSPPICAGVPDDSPQWPPDPRYKDVIAGQEYARQACDVGFTIYNSTSAPIPIMRNEELILLRAEANIGLGNLAAAQTDINFIRVNSGGLEPVVLTAGNALSQLLYEKRFSLLLEGGHRWLDLRRYDRLEEVPLDKPTHVRNRRYPIPQDELNAR